MTLVKNFQQTMTPGAKPSRAKTKGLEKLIRRTAVGAALIAAPLAFAAPALADPSSTVSCSNPCKPPTSGKTTTVTASGAPSTSSKSSSASTPQAPWEALTANGPWETVTANAPWEKVFGGSSGKGPWEQATSNGPWEKIWPGKDAKGPWENAVDKLTGGIAKALSPFG
ncbi:hypothetical protein [Mycobacterium sp. 852013-50091_SCH5140682]|uniref:hypothetical protein n=1 Tax=Mycobacterium sp. 852013-50091_SCH5140682 TaxID=1834109 RepID=UPI000B102C6B|nr:hypothetical protein [Mycobacterium sp. 852013-50091_SCH5140682]